MKENVIRLNFRSLFADQHITAIIQGIPQHIIISVVDGILILKPMYKAFGIDIVDFVFCYAMPIGELPVFNSWQAVDEPGKFLLVL